MFFVIVAMIHQQHLFNPIIDWALSLEPDHQPAVFYIANGALSMISDNVFVATVYIGEVKEVLLMPDRFLQINLGVWPSQLIREPIYLVWRP